MTWVPDSTQAGYLGPTTYSLEGIAWEDFLQEMVAGISGLPGDLVRPRWQPSPPTTPNTSVDWVGCGISRTDADWQVYNQHVDQDAGHDILRRHEHVTYLCSFYGPHSHEYAGVLRDGLFIDQNRAILRANAVGLVEVSEVARTADLFREMFRERSDLEILLNREVRRVYYVRTLLSSQGTIIGNDRGGRIVEAEWDTALIPAPEPSEE